MSFAIFERWPRPLQLAVGGLLCWSCTGCDKEYTVEMRPDGAAYERSFSAEGTSQRWATFYGEPAPQGEKHLYTGRFVGATPAELGGQGGLAYFDSPLGSASLYLERFGAPSLAVPRVTAIASEVEQLRADVGVWISREARTTDSDALSAFMNGTIAPDLLELTLQAQMKLGGASGSIDERFAELAAYLTERDYVALEEVPALYSRESLLATIHSLLDRKLQLTSSGRTALPEWKSDETLWRSIARTLPAVSGFAEWATARDPALDPQAIAALPSDELERVVLEWIQSRYPTLVRVASESSSVFGAGPYVTVHLRPEAEPVTTNGTWNADARRVEWKYRSIQPSGVLVYASWALPRIDEQTRRLGGVVLTGDALLGHVIEFAGLSPTDQAAWVAFVETLGPRVELAERLRAFRFPSDDANRDATGLGQAGRSPATESAVTSPTPPGSDATAPATPPTRSEAFTSPLLRAIAEPDATLTAPAAASP